METERLVITSPKINDAKAFMDIQNSNFVQKYNCMKQISLEEAKRDIIQNMDSNRVFFLYLKNTNTLIGAVFFSSDDLRYGVRSLSLSYYLKESETKNGYMSEALRTLIPYVFESCQLEVLTCRIFSENKASISMIEKLGFTYEGCLKHAVKASSGIIYDDCLYALHQKSDN